MTRSSVVAALVVTALLALLIVSGRERALERATGTLAPSAMASQRRPGEVAAVPSIRPVSPPPEPPSSFSPARALRLEPPPARPAPQTQPGLDEGRPEGGALVEPPPPSATPGENPPVEPWTGSDAGPEPSP